MACACSRGIITTDVVDVVRRRAVDLAASADAPRRQVATRRAHLTLAVVVQSVRPGAVRAIWLGPVAVALAGAIGDVANPHAGDFQGSAVAIAD